MLWSTTSDKLDSEMKNSQCGVPICSRNLPLPFNLAILFHRINIVSFWHTSSRVVDFVETDINLLITLLLPARSFATQRITEIIRRLFLKMTIERITNKTNNTPRSSVSLKTAILPTHLVQNYNFKSFTTYIM